MKDQTKSLLQEKIDKANYNTRGTANISIDGMNADEIKNVIQEIKNIPEYSSFSIDYNEETKTVNIINPGENIEGFEHTHPSRKACN